ncbi:MAG: GMC family oxidoreductase N-terminal domain-containing protein [Burkholderiales bacterium]|nr:GMC family oxidoreductase N-terminal domain-containing protein [Burkholderiales bacterium]
MTDILIVGGGTAGAVLAARLSQDPQRRVVLVEAGDDHAPGAEPADIRDAFPAATLNARYFWDGLTARATDASVPAPYPQARVMGGGSSINGLFALRGVPSDYDRWAQAGAGSHWSWDAVLPRFRQIENDLDHPTGKAGAPGPHAIARTPQAQWPAFARAMAQAAQRAGLPWVPDINEQPGDGFFAMPNAIGDDDARVTTAGCYLTAQVRARGNLRIVPNTFVTRLRVQGGAVRGVEAMQRGEPVFMPAGRVVVAAGGIHSPTLLLRSGIGPADELRAVGVQPVLDRAGVGRNLQNHPYLFFALTLPRGKRGADTLRRFALAGIRSSSHRRGCPPSDLFNFIIGRVSGQAFGPHFALVGSALYAPQSRGAVRLRSADPAQGPDIAFRFLSDPADPPRMLQAARLAEQLLRDPAVAAEYNEAFLLPGALAMKQFNRPGLAGQALALAARAAANSPQIVRRQIFGRAFKSGAPVAHRHGGRPITDAQLLSSISPMGHPVGTCAMGRADDPMAVVGEDFGVHGIGGLYVADASVMPVIPSANTNLPTIMVAERAVGRIQ